MSSSSLVLRPTPLVREKAGRPRPFVVIGIGDTSNPSETYFVRAKGRRRPLIDTERTLQTTDRNRRNRYDLYDVFFYVFSSTGRRRSLSPGRRADHVPRTDGYGPVGYKEISRYSRAEYRVFRPRESTDAPETSTRERVVFSFRHSSRVVSASTTRGLTRAGKRP